ncbi:FecR family protein [Steroidobacter flavus]|uniref:FecR family protein n=1 Tax=Steroidobacter flavus TaxID=1842136 RepID=A0ABV8T154_9GAMM
MKASMDSNVPESERVEEAAARWFARQHSEGWTDADQAQFDAWLDASTAHRVQYLRIVTTWEQSARMQALSAGVSPGTVPPRDSWGDQRFPGGSTAQAEIAGGEIASEPTRHHRRHWHFAAAALVAVALGLSMWAIDLRFAADRYTTALGGVENVSLGDGSKITLNTDTSIRVSFSDHERTIKLDKGEAFFEVAKDKTRPFIVYAGNKRVMAVGTRFSVRRDRDDIQVVVAEGRVNLAASPEQVLATPGANDGRGPMPATFLDAGAVARTSNDDVLVRPDAGAEVVKLLSWRKGYIYFDNVPLADAVAEFNRYNTRKMVIEDPEIGTLRVGGNFRSTNIDAFLELMQSGFPVAVDDSGDRIVLKNR